jgi:predicted permease
MQIVASMDPLLQLLGKLGHVFYTIVLPVLLVAAIGFLLQRRLGLDMPTLTRLNFYFVIPCLVYVSLVSSRITPGRAFTVVLFNLATMAAMMALTYVVAVVRRVPLKRRSALVMTTIFHNSGNYGLPLQRLAFRGTDYAPQAEPLQIFVMLTQNFIGFTIGILLAASGGKERHWKDKLLHVAKFPPLYALAAGLITIQIRRLLGSGAAEAAGALRPFWDVLEYIKSAFYAVALCTLGAQLATIRRGGADYPVRLSVLLRLLVGPAIGLALIYAFGLRGYLAQLLLISCATPTAVNCMLMCLEFDNHPDFAAKAVFYSTLLSPVTVTLTIFFAQGGFLPALTVP